MTREEAKELLIHIMMTYEPKDPYGDYYDTEPYEQALTMAIEALKAEPKCVAQINVDTEEVVRRIKEEYDIGFGEKKRDMVEVVRCKDCKYSKVYGKTTQWLACENVMEQATDPDGYCDRGERREL